MIYRTFQGLKLSGLGLGMMRLPTVGGNDAVVDEEKAGAIIDLAYRSGINYFDTAWGYHDGNSELTAGRCLAGYPRDSFYLATKFPGYDNSNMGKVREIFEKQLEKLRTDYFDFYLIHNVYEGNVDDYLDPKFGILPYLLEQKKAGRIRHFGFSSHGSIDVIKKFLSVYGPYMEFCQIQLNYMDWHFQGARDKVALLQEKGIPVWVMEPLRGGKLASAPADMAAELKAMRPDETVPGWAFRFLQAIPGVTMVLSGMSTLEQLQENLKTWQTDQPLTEAESDRLVALADAESQKGGLPCTACHYCTSHCPQGLPIPDLLAMYNEHKLTGGGFIAPMRVASMPENQRPASCLGCRSCEQVCPQQIHISDAMRELTEMLGM